MKLFDSHMHVVNTENLKAIQELLRTSKYRDIYLGYSAVRLDRLDISNHLKMCSGGFLMPYCFKETKPQAANVEFEYFIQTFSNHQFYFFPFIADNLPEYLDHEGVIGMKEHFYIHDSFRYHERRHAYQYLNDHRKLLIIHCDNSIRIQYIQYLAEQYPKMFIQVAHMGVFRNSLSASKLVIDELSQIRNVYFDISTVFDYQLLKYGIEKMEDRILYGTDVPYLQDENYVQSYQALVEKASSNRRQEEKLCYRNAERLVGRILS